MKAQTFNISLPKSLVTIMDKVAKKEFASRSDLIRSAIVSYIQKKSVWGDIFVRGEKKTAKLNIQEQDIESIIDDYRKTSL